MKRNRKNEKKLIRLWRKWRSSKFLPCQPIKNKFWANLQ